MKILFVAAEASPLAKMGGLAEVVGSLPKKLIDMGHDVRVMIPQYGCIDTKAFSLSKKIIKLADFTDQEEIDLFSTTIKGKTPLYLISNDRYFGEMEIYGSFEKEKFLFFSKTIVEVLQQLEWQPDIVHCHDWHAALAIMFIKKLYLSYSTVFTIHNMAYQGQFDEEFLALHKLDKYWQAYPQTFPKPPLNFLGQGIMYSDFITTVSISYAKEILTSEFGEGLDNILKNRQDSFSGIINGIDYDEYNPETDIRLPVNYSYNNIEKRRGNKRALQNRMGLKQSLEKPLLGLVQRLDEQKGIDILERAVQNLMNETDLQIVILGKGIKTYEETLMKISLEHSDRVKTIIGYDDDIAHLIYGGCDMFLMPSRYEPCGLGQLIAIRYGAIPIVRHTGGLIDTVPPFNEDLSEGNGFVFYDYSAGALVDAVKRAIQLFQQHPRWQKAASRIMKQDFSWQEPAKKYIEVYNKVLKT